MCLKTPNPRHFSNSHRHYRHKNTVEIPIHVSVLGEYIFIRRQLTFLCQHLGLVGTRPNNSSRFCTYSEGLIPKPTSEHAHACEDPSFNWSSATYACHKRLLTGWGGQIAWLVWLVTHSCPIRQTFYSLTSTDWYYYDLYTTASLSLT